MGPRYATAWKSRRLLAGAGARALGRGGGARMARISGLSRPTVYAGVRELAERPDPGGRVRRRGGGPKRRTTTDPGLLGALDALVDPDARGDPDEEWRLGAAVVNGAHVEERGMGGRRIWSRRRGDALAWVAVTGLASLSGPGGGAWRSGSRRGTARTAAATSRAG
jgi:hypothetical protein